MKMGLRGALQISTFVEAIRSGEQEIEDADEKQGRDKSLSASLNYGFRHAFTDDELLIIALLHLFQGTVDVHVLLLMGEGENSLPALKGKSKEHLVGVFERAKDIGFLTHLHETWFSIHPALPWFLRQIFVRYYDGKSGRSTSRASVCAWVQAVGALGSYYHDQFDEGNRSVINILELEEANMLHARRLARRNQWWSSVLSCMQGLRRLYEYQGRTDEWARLVEEIRLDYCTDDNEPIKGYEDGYSLVMDYRVRLARQHERNLAKATALQKKVVGFDRQIAAAALALPREVPIDRKQHNQLRTLSVSILTLGQILQSEGNADCLTLYREALEIDQRIGDKAAQAVDEHNLGDAYLTVSSIRELASSEAAYKRSLELLDPDDALGRSVCITQIGTVHYSRFNDALERNEPVETLLRLAQEAEKHYLGALGMCPSDAFTVLAPIHGQLGNLYHAGGCLDSAREHYEKNAQYSEKIGDRFQAGQMRFNIARMNFAAAQNEGSAHQQRANLLRARAYAEAALRDFQHFQGRATDSEVDTQHLLNRISQALAKLS